MKRKVSKILFLLFCLTAVITVANAASYQAVSVNVDIENMCVLELTHTLADRTFTVNQSDLSGLQVGNPASYVTVYPEDPSGIDVVVKSNSKNGVKLEVNATGNFVSTKPGNTEEIAIAQLKWSSDYGALDDVHMSLEKNECFSTDSEGIVSDTITFALDLFSMDSSGEYVTTLVFTASNLSD
ncbi:MAG: hypothetical protein ABIH39_08035 [Candidatus Margulisiibacteriota bacterium]